MSKHTARFGWRSAGAVLLGFALASCARPGPKGDSGRGAGAASHPSAAEQRLAELRARFDSSLLRALSGVNVTLDATGAPDPKFPSSVHASVEVSLPQSATEGVEIADSRDGLAIGVRLANAQAKCAEVAEGLVIYRDARGSGGDWIHRVRPDGLEDYVVATQASGDVEYLVDLSQTGGVRSHAGVVEFLDRRGVPRLRVTAPFFVDANGSKRPLSVEVRGCPVAGEDSAECQLVLRPASAESVAYPILVDPVWTTTNSTMIYRHSGHVAARLASGLVLVAGGSDSSAAQSNAELYDPQADTWIDAKKMNTARTNAAAVVLDSGKVLVAGGSASGAALDSAEVFDPQTGDWAKVAPMSVARVRFTLSLLPSGKVLAVGGFANDVYLAPGLASAEVFDPTAPSAAWAVSATPGPTVARGAHAAVSLGDGSVLVIGGSDAGAAISSAEIYREASGWLPAAPMNQARAAHTATRLADGRVLVAGGGSSDGELFVPPTSPSDMGSWIQLSSPMSSDHSDAAATLLPDGRVLIAGGTDGGTPIALTDIFDPKTSSFVSDPAQLPPMLDSRAEHTVTPLLDGRVLAAGGYSFDVPWPAELQSAEYWPRRLGAPCSGDSDCGSGHCADGVCCDAPCTGSCVSCVASKNGGSDGTCAAIPFGQDPDSECAATAPESCGTTGACDGTGQCQLYDASTVCGTAQCAAGVLTTSHCDNQGYCQPIPSLCAPFVCDSATSCGASCSKDIECAASAFCEPPSCVDDLDSGATCTRNAQCKSGHCVDGVCCESACNAPCQACSVALKASAADNGVCGPAKIGLDPRGLCVDLGAVSCQTDGNCDGKGFCSVYPASTACGPPTCSGATKVEYACDGGGKCEATNLADCSPFSCESGACTTSCSGTDCAPGAFCNQGSCKTLSKDGEACTQSGSCSSGYCVDGRCCNSECSGQCEACDVDGEYGTCVPVFGKPHGSRSACAAGGSAEPCSASTCNGEERGKCTHAGSDVACRTATCTQGVATLAAGCDAKGACQPETTVACAPYVCGTDACKTECSSATDCVAGTSCDSKTQRCVSDARCDGHVLTAGNGEQTDCAPFTCDAKGFCLHACTESSECVTPYVCKDKSCTLPEAPAASPDDNGCGCRLPAGGTSGSSWILLLGAAAFARRRRKRRNVGGLVAIAVGLASLACSNSGSAPAAVKHGPSPDVGPSAAAVSVLARLERSVGALGDPSARFVRLDDGRYAVDVRAARARVELPPDAAGSRLLLDPVSGLSVGVTMQGASASRVGFARGQAVYPKAIGDADLVVRSDAAGVEDFVIFPHSPRRARVDYDIELSSVAGLRLVANVLELLDAAGAPRLRMASPYLIDRGGNRHDARVSVHGCAVDVDARPPWDRPVIPPDSRHCVLSIDRDGTIAYPAVLDPSWVLTKGFMTTARVDHGAALLPDGRVLLIGGTQLSGELKAPTSSTEYFDPTTETFAAGPDLPAAVSKVVAVTLASGAVLVLGGTGGPTGGVTRADVYRLDAGSSSWAVLPPLKSARTYHTATLLSDGRILVAGGSAQVAPTSPIPNPDVEIYDPAATCASPPTPGCASTLLSMQTPRAWHTATALAGGAQVLVVGGIVDVSGNATNLTELFDLNNPGGPAFILPAPPPLPSSRAQHSAVLLGDGRVIVAGGVPGGVSGALSSAEIYSPSGGGSWTATEMPETRSEFPLIRLNSGQALAIGGFVAATAWFDPASDAWSPGPAMNFSRAGHSGTRLNDGRVLAAGGKDGTASPQSTAELLDLESGGVACSMAEDCVSGYCVDGVCCDTACAGTCVACTAAKKGGGQEGICGPVGKGSDPHDQCDMDFVCGQTGFCDGAGQCELFPAQTPCGTAQCVGSTRHFSECNGTGNCVSAVKDCAPSSCIGQGVCSTNCANDADCTNGFCEQSQCKVKLADGTSCDASNQCTSGYCVDGVCCATACDAPCQACSAAGKQSGAGDGICGSALDGTDPHDNCTDEGAQSCGNDGTCDGTGACHKYASGTACGVTTCVGGAKSGNFCDGSGVCKAQIAPCEPYSCAAGECKDSCATLADCAAGYYCTQGLCVAQSKLGNQCVTVDSCASSFCVDGYCCDSPCSGQCQACDVEGSLGACLATQGFPHGSRPACDESLPAEPCQAHRCDGTNTQACTSFVREEVTCRDATCAQGFATESATCDGAGHCPPPQQIACNGAVCDGDKCRESCASNEDCAKGASCNRNTGHCVYGVACDDQSNAAVLPDGSEVSCAPYRCVATGCATACVSHVDCIDGYVCSQSRCVSAPPAAADEAGCGCHVGAPGSERFAWLVVLGALAWIARRRRSVVSLQGPEDDSNVETLELAADSMATLARASGRRAASLAMVGELVGGRYRVTRHIADGGMGVVCEAIHEGTGKRVALKIVRDVVALGDDRNAWLSRFRREARAVGSLDCRHVTQVFDAGTDEASGQPFIAMELLDGADLARVLKHIGPLPPETALKIVGQACLALERAHAAGIIHRDIKPANVFLSANESDEITVKLVDFGVAKIVPEAGEAELTQTGSILGTPTYMSPEQAKGTRALDHRADLWALAVVLYKLLTGRVPHPKREGLGELILTICTKPAPPVQEHAPWLTPEVAHVLDRALQLELERRYQSASEFRAEIERLLPDGIHLRRSGIRPLSYDERCRRARRLISVFPPARAESCRLPAPLAHSKSDPRGRRIVVAAGLCALVSTVLVTRGVWNLGASAPAVAGGAVSGAAQLAQAAHSRIEAIRLQHSPESPKAASSSTDSRARPRNSEPAIRRRRTTLGSALAEAGASAAPSGAPTSAVRIVGDFE
jgi:MYXO-CTERM domain-containing protein